MFISLILKTMKGIFLEAVSCPKMFCKKDDTFPGVSNSIQLQPEGCNFIEKDT